MHRSQHPGLTEKARLQVSEVGATLGFAGHGVLPDADPACPRARWRGRDSPFRRSPGRNMYWRRRAMHAIVVMQS